MVGSAPPGRPPLSAAPPRAAGLEWALASGAVRDLDKRWADLHRAPPADAYRLVGSLPGGGEESEIVVIGGGLGLVLAAALQRRGHSVTLLDRGRVGDTHREWNSSRLELGVLERLGLPTEGVVTKEYRTGFVEFAHMGPSGEPPARSWLPGVLDVAVSSRALLSGCRAAFLAAGGRLRENEPFRRLEIGPKGVRVEGEGGAYRARVAVDAMGVLSPVQFQLHRRPYDWVCPTVGSVARGLGGVDPSVGEVLYTNRPAEPDGRQLIWELFPLPRDEAAVYLFHYAPVGEEGTLEALFGDYFRLLGEYHDDGGAEHLKPVYGYIPSRHRRRSASLPRVVPVGDAAAWNSPLTFTGFGSFLRNLPRVVELLELALARDTLTAADTARVSARQANLELLWSLAHFMRPLPGDRGSVNRILDAFNRAMNDLGLERARRFYQDRGDTADFLAILSTMMSHYPSVWRHALRRLGPAGLARLFASVGLTAGREGLAWAAGRLPPPREPHRALAWRAAALEHEVMARDAVRAQEAGGGPPGPRAKLRR